MVHPDRQKNLVRMAREVEKNGVRGAIIECDVLGRRNRRGYGVGDRRIRTRYSYIRFMGRTPRAY